MDLKQACFQQNYFKVGRTGEKQGQSVEVTHLKNRRRNGQGGWIAILEFKEMASGG